MSHLGAGPGPGGGPCRKVLSECTFRSALTLAGLAGNLRHHWFLCGCLWCSSVVQSWCHPAGACSECTGAEAGRARAGRAVLHLLGPARHGWAPAWVQVRGWQVPSGHRMSCHAAANCDTVILPPCWSLDRSWAGGCCLFISCATAAACPAFSLPVSNVVAVSEQLPLPVRSIHKCCCRRCAAQLKTRHHPTCPVCRQPIERVVMAIYGAC